MRPATVEDADQLAELNDQLGYAVERQVFRQRLQQLLPRANQIIFVAELPPGRKVIGWIQGEEREILAIGRYCEVVGLVVNEAHRGAGVGRCLMEAVERWAADRDLEQVSLRSNVVRPESHAFYEKIGYARFKTQHAYRKRV